MGDNAKFVTSEVKTLEESYSYLSGLGYPPPDIMNMLYLSVQLQQVNLQARALAKQDFANEEMVQRIASQVSRILKEGTEKPNDGT